MTKLPGNRVVLDSDDILGQDMYRELFMPVGDDLNQDIERLIRQSRIHKNL